VCGFAGFIQFEEQSRSGVDRREILHRMGVKLAQRGPDEQQIYDDGVLSFVFRRLSIIDLKGGSQPFLSEDGSVVAAVNGEIYNHHDLRRELESRYRFTGGSDCEVTVPLYQKYGTGAPERLNGIFAMLVWDRRRRTLLLARDRLGVKPLCYARLPHGLLFASELKALLMHPDCPTRMNWSELDLGYLEEDDTYTSPDFLRIPSFVEGVRWLEGGHVLEFDSSLQSKSRPYWSLSGFVERSSEESLRPRSSYVEQYAALLDDAIGLQLMSDVPVGAFLSGGLDSSAIVAHASHKGVDLQCFSMCERTTVATGDLDRARQLTQDLKLPFHPVWFNHETFADQIEFSLASLEYFVYMIDAPRFAPEYFFKHELHRYARTQAGAPKVMLLGQGADEFAGGYSLSYTSPRANWSHYVEALSKHHHSLDMREAGVPGSARPSLRPGAISNSRIAPFHREMLRRVWCLQSHNLWNEDRVSSSQGVEARVPFLDHRLVEFLALIPAELHPDLFWNKSIIREAVSPRLDRRYAQAPKVLFWQSKDTSSVHRMMRNCMLRSYADFRDSYQGVDQLFSTASLDQLYLESSLDHPGWIRASRTLLGCMTVAVFERMCRTLRQEICSPTLMGPPSPLKEHHGNYQDLLK